MLLMTEFRSAACRRRLVSAKSLKSSHTATGSPASSSRTSNTKKKLTLELCVFFMAACTSRVKFRLKDALSAASCRETDEVHDAELKGGSRAPLDQRIGTIRSPRPHRPRANLAPSRPMLSQL